MRTVAHWEDYIVCRSWMTALSSEMERTTGGNDEVSDAFSAAPTYHLQNISSHDHCGCHLTIKQIISWLLQMIRQSGQGSNTLICLPELPHSSGFLPLMLLQSRGPQRFTWHWISYCLCIFRGKKAMDEVQIFIWAPPQGVFIQDKNSLILQVLVHKLKDDELWWFLGFLMQSTK